jgi:hypothetical protein
MMVAVPTSDSKATVLKTLFHCGRGEAHAYQAAKQQVPADAKIGDNPAPADFPVWDAVLEAGSPPPAIILTARFGRGKRRSRPSTLSATMNLQTGSIHAGIAGCGVFQGDAI